MYHSTVWGPIQEVRGSLSPSNYSEEHCIEKERIQPAIALPSFASISPVYGKWGRL